MKKLILGISSLVAIGGLTTTLILTLGGKEPTPEPTPTPPVEVCVHEYNDATYTYSNDMLKVTGVAKCEKCKKEITETVNVNSYIITEATCTSDGLINYVSDTFSNSLFTVQTKEVTTTSSGHNLVHHNAQSPTCAEKGWNEYDTCLYCDYSTYKEIDKLNHNYTITYTWNDDNTKVTATRTCSNNVAETVTETVNVSKEVLVFTSCGEKGTEKLFATFTKPYFETQSKIVDVDVLGHNLVTVEGKAPTCTETGLTDKIYCDRCNYVEQESELIETTGHDLIWEGVVVPTMCGEQGCTGTEKCKNCGKIFTEPTYYANENEHELVYIEAKETNCVNGIGYTAGEVCVNCDYKKGMEEIPIDEDLFKYHVNLVLLEETEVKATCTESGYYFAKYNCSSCEQQYGDGIIIINKELTKLNHDYECTEGKLATSLSELPEFDSYTCKICGDFYYDFPTGDINWHNYKFDGDNTPTSSTLTTSTKVLSDYITIKGNIYGQLGISFVSGLGNTLSYSTAVNSTTYTNNTLHENGYLGEVTVNLKDGSKKEYKLTTDMFAEGLVFDGVKIDDVENIDATFIFTRIKQSVQYEMSYNFKVYNEKIVIEDVENPDIEPEPEPIPPVIE